MDSELSATVKTPASNEGLKAFPAYALNPPSSLTSDELPRTSPNQCDANILSSSSEAALLPLHMTDLERELQRLLSSGAKQLRPLYAEPRPVVLDPVFSLGEVEACVKPHRPDGLQESLGISVFDEPTLFPTDIAVLILRLRTTLCSAEGLGGLGAFKPGGYLRAAERRTRDVEAWVAAVKAHHQQRNAEAASAGFDAEAIMADRQPYESMDPSFAAALREHIPFFLFELPDLSLTVQQLASFVCCLAGAAYSQNASNILSELLKLFCICI